MKRTFPFVLAIVALLLLIPIGFDRSSAWAALAEFDLAWQTAPEGDLSHEIEAPATNIGLTWDGEAPESAWFRVRQDDVWSGWAPVPIEDEHGPDPGTAEAVDAKPGSDLVWVGAVDAAQFRVEGGDGSARATMIDTTDRSKPLAQKFRDLFTEPTAEAAASTPGRPTIRPRSAWDPSGSCTPRTPVGPDDIGQMTHAFVHHTTGTNSYTVGQVPGRILGICLFHINSRGWNDIGYNFLIDRFGVIWEGRAGGVDKGVQGAHTAGFNSYSIGVAFLGDHGSSRPTAAAEAALVNLISWKFGVHNVNPTAITTLVSKGSEKWPEGTPVSLHPVSGHRDGQATSCPGEACYRRLPSYRSLIDNRWDQVPLTTYRSPLTGDFDGDGAHDAAIFSSIDGVWRVLEAGGTPTPWSGAFAPKTGWTALAGDFDGDGRTDIANYSGTGTWWVSRSTGSGFKTTLWSKEFTPATGWTFVPGDFDGDGRTDIASYSKNGTWWISRSTGSGFKTTLWSKEFTPATGWTFVPGDFDGDARTDIANYYSRNGTWWISRSTGSGFTTTLWSKEFTPATGWTFVPGDFDGDGRTDIANYYSGNGTWWVSRSTGTGFSTRNWGSNKSFDHFSHFWTQNLDGDDDDDLMGIDAYNGFVYRHRSSGTAFTIQSLVDTPWRTTFSTRSPRQGPGSTAWLYFAQEFTWVRLTGLNSSTASATPSAILPRP